MSVTDKIIDKGFKPEIYENSPMAHKPAGLAEFIRDMRRLDELRNQSEHPGLNSFEDKEAEKLREKYSLSHLEWWQKEYKE